MVFKLKAESLQLTSGVKQSFTLMEILIAAAVFTVVVSLVTGIFMITLRNYGESNTAAVTYGTVKRLNMMVSKDISSMLVLDNAGKEKEFFKGLKTEIFFLLASDRGPKECGYIYDAVNKELFRAYVDNDYSLNVPEQKELVATDVVEFELSYYFNKEWIEELTNKYPKAVKIHAVISTGHYSQKLEEIIYVPSSE